MSRSALRSLSLVGGTAILGASRVAAAQAPEEIELRYEAPAQCPTEAAFRKAVEARRGDAPLSGEPHVASDPAGHRRSFDLRIVQEARRYHGTLRVSEGEDVRERVVDEARCEDAVRALAVFTAIALDVDRPAPPPAPPPPPPLAPPKVAPSGDQGMLDLPDVPPGTEPLDRYVKLERQDEAEPHHPRFRVGVGFNAHFNLPGGTGGGASIDVSRDRFHGLAPMVRVGASYSRYVADHGMPALPDSGTVAVATGFLDLCPLRFDEIDIYVHTCLRGELGHYEAQYDGGAGSFQGFAPPDPAFANLHDPGSKSGVWGAVGATAGIRGNLGTWFFSEVEGGVLLPVTRARLDAGWTSPFTTPSVVGWFGLSIGVYLVAIKTSPERH